MMLRALVPVLAAAATLAACEPTKIGPGAQDGRAEARREEAVQPKTPVVLPPSIIGTRTYRCSDNSLLSVEFYSDRASATVRAGEKGASVRVKAPEPGGRMIADGGWSLEGGAKDERVAITTPDRSRPLSCHV